MTPTVEGVTRQEGNQNEGSTRHTVDTKSGGGNEAGRIPKGGVDKADR